MKRPESLLLFVLCAAIATAQPVVNQGGVLNAASYGLDPLPNAGIAQGSIFTAFGSGLGPATFQQASGFPLLTSLAGTSIAVKSGGATVNAFMLWTTAGQVAAILPSQTPVGAATLTLTYGGKASAPVSITVVRSNFGIFARNSAGTGPAIVQNYVSPVATPLNSPIAPAQPGQVLILWGTGLGPVSVDETGPPGAVDPGTDVEVWVGNERATVLYKGRTPSYPGEDQINFQLPQDVVQGCYVPVAIKAGGVVSNFGSIAIASQGSVCSDPHGPAPGDLQRIANGESLKLAWLQLLRENFTLSASGVTLTQGKMDIVFGDFFRWDSNAVGQSVAVSSAGGVALGTCTVTTGNTKVFNSMVLRGGPHLNVGTALNLQGPNGSKSLSRDAAGLYEKNPLGGTATLPLISMKSPPYLEPGAYSVDNGTGGADATPFQATLSIRDSTAPLTWTNPSAIQAIDRSQDLTVTWTGGDPAREYVIIGGTVVPPALGRPQAMAVLSCAQRADAGQIIIPAWVLSALPASSTDPTANSFGVGRAPLLAGYKFSGGSIDAGYFSYAEMTLQSVSYR